MHVSIFDCGLGNIYSVKRAFEYLGASVSLGGDKNFIDSAHSLVFPGQGAIEQLMSYIDTQNLENSLRNYIESGRPFLGICLGFQFLFDYSDEDGGCKCLGLSSGNVKAFEPKWEPVPQMGWNTISFFDAKKSILFQEIPDNSYMYFVHSFFVDDVNDEAVISRTIYGIRYVSSIQIGDSAFGVQFHPEKSGVLGLKVLKNFLSIIL